MEFLLALVFVALAGVGLYYVIRYILKERYFASDEFIAHKGRIAKFVAEHNEVAKYVSEIRSRGSFTVAHRPPAHSHIWRRFRTPAIGTTAGIET